MGLGPFFRKWEHTTDFKRRFLSYRVSTPWVCLSPEVKYWLFIECIEARSRIRMTKFLRQSFRLRLAVRHLLRSKSFNNL